LTGRNKEAKPKRAKQQRTIDREEEEHRCRTEHLADVIAWDQPDVIL
jgi:hypothetical protein